MKQGHFQDTVTMGKCKNKINKINGGIGKEMVLLFFDCSCTCFHKMFVSVKFVQAKMCIITHKEQKQKI